MADATQFFPEGFLWGTSTSSHQVEGGNRNNDWWEWEKRLVDQPPEIHASGDAAGWWAGRAEEDIQLMKDLNTGGHRFSLEWSRIQPREDKFDLNALDRYRDILMAMRDAGIRPMVTLHHFTNPTWFAARGGWMHPDAPALFDAYVRKTVSYLSDLVDLWCTINEPDVYASKAYLLGIWPPGMKSMKIYLRVLRQLLTAHAAAYQTIHDIQHEAQVGLAKNMIRWMPLTNSPIDRWGAYFMHRNFNRLTLDTLEKGIFDPPFEKKSEIAGAAGTLDWIGINYYMRQNVHFKPGRGSQILGFAVGPREDFPHGPLGWGEFDHDSLFTFIKEIYSEFKLPIYITENGIPEKYDLDRPAFILQSLQKVWKAAMFNIPVKGYFFWSLVDNFEWEMGYLPQFRFGLFSVDPVTQERTPKRSAELFKRIAAGNAISSELAREFAPKIADTLYPGDPPI